MSDRTNHTAKYKEPLHADAELVKSCLRGDLASQRQLYDDYSRLMFRVCLRYCKSREDAEDCLQDGFIKVFKDLRQYRGTGPLGAWIRKVMVNTALMQLRKQKNLFPNVEIDAMSPSFSRPENFSGHIDAETMTRVISALPAGYRTVFNMYCVEGYKHHEIADALGITVGTSKSQLSKARAMLKKQLKNLFTEARFEYE